MKDYTIEEIMEKLESIEDELKAAQLLGQFDQKSKAYHQLLMNRDPQLSHQDWKTKCDNAKKELEEIIKQIDFFAKTNGVANGK